MVLLHFPSSHWRQLSLAVHVIEVQKVLIIFHHSFFPFFVSLTLAGCLICHCFLPFPSINLTLSFCFNHSRKWHESETIKISHFVYYRCLIYLPCLSWSRTILSPFVSLYDPFPHLLHLSFLANNNASLQFHYKRPPST